MFRSCLRGAAVGDALGAPIEFMSWPEIKARYSGPVRRMEQSAWGCGVVTDDTQMTLFTAEGLIEANQTQQPVSIAVWKAYQRWLFSQRHSYVPGYKGLLRMAPMWGARAPGATCLGALSAAYQEHAPNDSAGCGAAMRAAPCGLVARSIEDAFELGCVTGRLTHGHPDGYLSAGYVAAVVHQLSRGASREEAVRSAGEQWMRTSHSDVSIRLPAERYEDPEAMTIALGEGWTGHTAAALATYALMQANSFVDGIVIAVNHGGDSDSVGCIAGAMLGAHFQQIPDLWVRQLDVLHEVDAIADQLKEVHRVW